MDDTAFLESLNDRLETFVLERYTDVEERFPTTQEFERALAHFDAR